MSTTISQAVKFDIDRLFNGAVDVNWLVDGSGKAEKAAKAFVFHGPSSHGVSQRDLAGSSHRLIDTASFVQQLVRRVETSAGNAFTLAIAGYGSGKSHLAVTISELLSSDDKKLKSEIIDNISQADAEIGRTVAQTCENLGKTLVVTINGMNNGDLSSSLVNQIRAKIIADGLDETRLENLHQRFRHASNLLQQLKKELTEPLVLECGVQDRNELIERLDSLDEETYKKVHKFLKSIGIPLAAVSDETARDVIALTVREFVGKGRPYNHMLILFDEFGHYMEFATSHPQIAGDGALQHVFEGVQGNDTLVTFVGFVQYELKAYAQRLPSEFKNELNRFITRFDNADKLYLSSNLETLIANLLRKKIEPEIDVNEAGNIQRKIFEWYPSSQNFSTWSDSALYQQVIVRGCWPLSPVAMWVLFYLSSSGKYLQQRSALTLLKSALDANENRDASFPIPAVGLWTTDLQQEFEGIDETSENATVLQSYNSVCAKFGMHMSQDENAVLRAIVLMAQTQIRAVSKRDAEDAIATFTGLDEHSLDLALNDLLNEKNVIEWDESSRSFEILSDNASRPQFLHILRVKAAEYNENRVAEIFCGLAPEIESFVPPECSFRLTHNITTPEWRYEAKYTHWDRFKLTIETIADELDKNGHYQVVDGFRGLILYCYLNANEVVSEIKETAAKILKKFAARKPIILVLVQDDAEHYFSKALVDIDILSRLEEKDRSKFGHLINAQEQKVRQTLKLSADRALKERNYVTPFANIEAKRMAIMGQEVFEAAYPKVLSFQFDGYGTPRGNASKDCADFTKRLVSSDFSFADTQSMSSQQRNRAQMVLNAQWKVFSKKDGSVVQKPQDPVVKAIMADWEEKFSLPEGLNCAEAIAVACNAPYGANLASAGLLFGVFVQAFQKVISANNNGELVSLQAIGSSLFSGSVLNTTYLSGITFSRITGENGEWDQLIADWAACITYYEQAAFIQRIDELEKSRPVPPALRYQIEQDKQEAINAKAKIDDFENHASDHIERIERCRERGDAFGLAYGASLLWSLAESMRKDNNKWRAKEDIEPIVLKVTEAKSDIARLFPAWLNANRPRGYTPNDLVNFKRDSEDRMGRNLKNLGLNDQLDLLKSQVEKVSKNFERIAQAQKTLTDYDSWESQYGIINKTTPMNILNDLNQQAVNWSQQVHNGIMLMTRANNTDICDELQNRIAKIKTLTERIKEAKKAIDKRGSAVWKADLTVETAPRIRDEIKDLLDLYKGDANNLEDFRIAHEFVIAFMDAAARIDSLQIPQSQFELLQSEVKNDLIKRFGDDNEPPWDVEETFDAMVKVIGQKRRKASADWITKMKASYADVESMSMHDAEVARRDLESPPPCFDEHDTEAQKVLVRRIERHLESKGVEWLIEKYRQLSPAAQKTFLKMVKGG